MMMTRFTSYCVAFAVQLVPVICAAVIDCQEFSFHNDNSGVVSKFFWATYLTRLS